MTRWSVVVFRVGLIPLILNLLLPLVQISNLQRAHEMVRDWAEERVWERERGWAEHEREKAGGMDGGRGEDHEGRSVTWRGKAKNNTLIIHILGFEVGDSQLLTETEVAFTRAHQGLGVRGWKAGQWIMCEQHANPESAVSVPVQGGGTVMRKTTNISSPPTDEGKALIISLKLTGANMFRLYVVLLPSDLNQASLIQSAKTHKSKFVFYWVYVHPDRTIF